MKEETFPCPFWTTSKKCSAKNQIVFIILAHWANAFWHSTFFQQVWQKKTIENFNHFWTLSEKFSPFCQKSWSRAARTAFYVFTGTVWKIYLPEKSLKLLLSFSDTERKTFGFCHFFSMGLSIVYSTCPWEHFNEKSSLKMYLSFHFFCGLWQEQNFEENFLKKTFLCHFLSTSITFSVVKTVFYVSRGTF